MYLRRVREAEGVRYVLRESVVDEGVWISRDLMDLGEDPARFIIYPGGNGYYFDPELESVLEAKGVRYCAEELEQAFLPFLRADIRRVVEMFSGRQGGIHGRGKDAGSDEQLATQHMEMHGFDKRRLHFLRFGHIDCGNLDGRPWKFLKVLLNRSRDEVEHVLEEMESRLRPHEMKSYLYSAFYLERYFQGHLLKHHPIGLDPEKVDACFLDELCRLNRDRRFFSGVPEHRGDCLHGYLRKYLILFFDSDYGGRRLDPSFYREFINRRRAYGRAFAASAPLPVEEALRIFSISREELGSMDQDGLSRHFRKIAKDAHPDHGGDHEAFIKITDAYEVLKRRIP